MSSSDSGAQHIKPFITWLLPISLSSPPTISSPSSEVPAVLNFFQTLLLVSCLETLSFLFRWPEMPLLLPCFSNLHLFLKLSLKLRSQRSLLGSMLPRARSVPLPHNYELLEGKNYVLYIFVLWKLSTEPGVSCTTLCRETEFSVPVFSSLKFTQSLMPTVMAHQNALIKEWKKNDQSFRGPMTTVQSCLVTLTLSKRPLIYSPLELLLVLPNKD